jgi:hypothetical protein
MQNLVVGFGVAYLMPLNNPYNTTVMPVDFRFKLLCIMVSNLVTLCLWYVYSFNNGFRPLFAHSKIRINVSSNREYLFVNGVLYKMYSFGKDEGLEYDSTERDNNHHPKLKSEYKEILSSTLDEASVNSVVSLDAYVSTGRGIDYHLEAKSDSKGVLDVASAHSVVSL